MQNETLSRCSDEALELVGISHLGVLVVAVAAGVLGAAAAAGFGAAAFLACVHFHHI